MFHDLKIYFKFLLMKYRWRKKYGRFTYPGFYFDMDHVCIGEYTYGKINAHTSNITESLRIGRFCSIASSARFLLSGEHELGRISTYPFKEKILNNEIDTTTKGDIIIGDDVWIGENSLILSGVHVGQGAVIAAGSIVCKDIPPYSIVGGVPARIIKYRFSKKMIDELIKIDYGQIDENFIRKHIRELYVPLSSEKQLEWLPKKKI